MVQRHRCSPSGGPGLVEAMSAGILQVVPNQYPVGRVTNGGEGCLSVSVRT